MRFQNTLWILIFFIISLSLNRQRGHEVLTWGQERMGSDTVEHAPKLPKWAIPLLSGGLAGTVAKSAIAPLERVKILFQIRSIHYPFNGVFPTLHSIYINEGIAGLWKGNNATVLRIFPYAAIQFYSYEKFKQASDFYGKKQNSSGHISSCTSIRRNRGSNPPYSTWVQAVWPGPLRSCSPILWIWSGFDWQSL